jgi:hypothetical protein
MSKSMKNALILLKLPDTEAKMNDLFHLMTKYMGLCAKQTLNQNSLIKI